MFDSHYFQYFDYWQSAFMFDSHYFQYFDYFTVCLPP
jgi:hypothetical protein